MKDRPFIPNHFRLIIGIISSIVLIAMYGLPVVAQTISPVSLVSINVTGTGGGSDLSGFPVISADGRYVLFSSDATNLVSNYTRYMDTYVRDLQTSTTIPVNVNRYGTGGANGPSGAAYLSSSGRYVVFESVATDLVTTADTNNTNDVFVRDMQTGVTTLISVNRFGTAAGNGLSYLPRVTADGRFVVFTSYASDLVENYKQGEQGLFVRDTVAGTTTLIVSGVPNTIIIEKNPLALRPTGDIPEVADYHPVFSGNGRYMVFSCNSRLVSNDIDGPPSKAYLRDLYTGATTLLSINRSGYPTVGGALGVSADGRFVLLTSPDALATDLPTPFSLKDSSNLYVKDVQTQQTKLVTISSDEKSDARDSFGSEVVIRDPAISADGRFVTFVTRATNLTPEKLNSTFEDIFVRDTIDGVTKLGSINAWGTASGNRQSWLPKMSGDGRFIAFYSRASDLVYNDNNDLPNNGGTEDVFVRDTQLGTTILASINRFGSASANNWSLNPIISADGNRVVFTSIASDLVPYDTNGIRNIYAYNVPSQFGQVQFSASSFLASEGDGSAAITVTRTGGSEGVAIDYATAGGTASSRSDYTPAVGTLHFNPGEVSKAFKVLITDDSTAKGSKTVNLILSNPSGGVVLASPSAATLTITDNDATSSGVNPIDDSRFYVRQHYLDFLNREPDSAGLQFWTNEIEQCGADAQCGKIKRINVSTAFFLSTEFQETGFLVYRFYQAAYKRAPTYGEFLADTQALSQGVIVGAPGWETQLELNKQMFTNAFADRLLFKNMYENKLLSGFWQAISANTGVTVSDALLNDLSNGKETRATFLRKMAEDPTFSAKQFNAAFVLMQYFGYLRRNPNDAPDSDFLGYNFWLNKLNAFNGDYQAAEMVKAFILSSEYRQRFGP
jgi:hypothetical protein